MVCVGKSGMKEIKKNRERVMEDSMSCDRRVERKVVARKKKSVVGWMNYIKKLERLS